MPGRSAWAPRRPAGTPGAPTMAEPMPGSRARNGAAGEPPRGSPGVALPLPWSSLPWPSVLRLWLPLAAAPRGSPPSATGPASGEAAVPAAPAAAPPAASAARSPARSPAGAGAAAAGAARKQPLGRTGRRPPQRRPPRQGSAWTLCRRRLRPPDTEAGEIEPRGVWAQAGPRGRR